MSVISVRTISEIIYFIIRKMLEKSSSCLCTSSVSPDEFGWVSPGTVSPTICWRSWLYSEVFKLHAMRDRLSMNLGSRRGSYICSIERHWGYPQLRNAGMILLSWKIVRWLGLGDLVGGWPDIFPQYVYLKRLCQDKSKDITWELAPKKWDKSPNQLQLSQATEKFMGMVEAESSYYAVVP